MRRAGDSPKGNEVYFNASYSLTPGVQRGYLYSAEANQVYAVPASLAAVVAPPAPAPNPGGVCWDRQQLITNGFTPGRAGQRIRSLVWHDMEGWLAGAISRWNTGAAGAHLCVLRSGEVVLTCRLEDTAWHAGTDNNPASGVYGRTAFWRGHNINAYSIGVELEGFQVSGYTAAQAAACRRISDWATAKYGIVRAHTFDQLDGHHAHGEISSQRSDPGPLFNWGWVL